MKPTRRTLLAAMVVAALLLLLLSRGAYVALLGLFAAAQTIATDHPVLAAGLVVVFAALAAMLAFVSSWVVVPFVVFTWGSTAALLLLWAGWLLGGVLSYAVGRFLGRPAVHRLTASARVAHYEQVISARSSFGLVLLLQLGLPSEIPGYLLGLVRYSFGRYFASLALAALVHGAATVYLGAQLLERRVGPMVAMGAGLALLTLTAAYGLRASVMGLHVRHTLRDRGAPRPLDLG